MNEAEINDIREPPHFKGVSFSKFKKADVRKQFIDNMLKSKVEPACYWCAELICAGHYSDVWETIIYYVGKHIHMGNPKIVIYIQMRYENFKKLMSSGFSELQLRNNISMRQLFAEIVSILTLSNKKNSFEAIKINKTEEFDMTQISERLKASSIHFAEPIIKPEDPKELFIAVNEFAYHLSIKNLLSACYWIEWIIEFEYICKKRKQPIYCERRSFVDVDKKCSRDIVWIIWDALIHYSSLVSNSYINKLMKGLVDIFSIRYTTASCKKYRYLLYFAVEVITETITNDVELISDKNVVQTVVSKIQNIYKQIKKNEVSPNTEYLFANLEKDNNLEKSIRQIELVNSITITNEKF